MAAFQSDLEPVKHKEYVNIWGKNLFANKERKRERQTIMLILIVKEEMIKIVFVCLDVVYVSS
jgi:hypothetical protein